MTKTLVHRASARLDRLIPGAFQSLVWEIVLALITFPASIVMSRRLGAEGRGVLTLAVLVPTTVFTLGTFQWDRTLRGLISMKVASPAEAYRRTIGYLRWLSVPAVLFGIGVTCVYPLSPQARLFSALFCTAFPLSFLMTSLMAVYTAAGRLDITYRIKFLYQATYLVAVCGFALANRVNVPFMITTYVLMHLAAVAYAMRAVPALTGETNSGGPDWQPLARGFGPYALESLGARADIWVLSLLATPAILGQYSAVTTLASPISMLSMAVATGSTARLAWTDPLVVRRHLRNVIIAMLACLLTFGSAAHFLSGWLLHHVLGKDFDDGAWMATWIVAIAVTQAIAYQFHTALQLSGRQNGYLTVQAIEPIARILLTLVGGKIAGIRGVLASFLLITILKSAFSEWLLRSTRPAVHPS